MEKTIQYDHFWEKTIRYINFFIYYKDRRQFVGIFFEINRIYIEFLKTNSQ